MNQSTKNSYPKSWYPILRSNDLLKNKKKLIKAFDYNWLVFRDSDGQVGVVSRYCCHMGSDLSNGKMVNGCIECPLHGWQFNRQGKCQSIPALGSNNQGISKNKKLISLLSKEAYGIIFVFFGEKPEYDIPMPPNMDSVSWGKCQLYSLSSEFHAPCLNTFDLQHYQHIHHRKILSPPSLVSQNVHHLGIKMNAEVVAINWLDKLMKRLVKGSATISIDCWGASMLLMSNHKTGYGAIITMIPSERYQSSMFIVPVKMKSANKYFGMRFMDKLSLAIAAAMIKGFLSPDKRALSGMKPIEGSMVEELDYAATRYWAYYNALPRYCFNDLHSIRD